ncbi:hypothetical protein [Paenibacillus eucommiae]|uniref:ArpU family transcriptional regulator n=1 Tax=Paenibacillus eucommiae TaxID=1355755 RepID=A0ABS4IYD2_9BACL|nr:hypothetical protein [Paenibacillus eucommiae]MBP1992533.1 hypothetical protein [Paenibacillus eucommiae]
MENDFDNQIELFQRATLADIKESKKHLKLFMKYQAMIAEFERRGLDTLSTQQHEVYQLLKNRVLNLQSAINLIIDAEIKEMIEYRYIKGNKHVVTIEHFAENMDDRTVERKLCKGIESVAESLKIMTVK